MAFKALLGLVFVIGVTMGGGHSDRTEPMKKTDMYGEEHHEEKEMMKKDEMKHKDYKMTKKDHEEMDENYMKKNMDGMMKMPMMCYHKKGKMGMMNRKKMKGGKDGKKLGKGMSEMLNQAARLLGVVMMETGGGDEMNMESLNEMKKMLQEMMKGNMEGKHEKEEEDKEESEHEHEETESELGQDLLKIVTNILDEGGSIPGVTITITEDAGEEEDSTGGHSSRPMNDAHTKPELLMPVEGGLGGALGNFDLKSLGLDVKGLIEMIKNPSMSFLVDSLGLGPLIKLLDDPTISAIVESLDLDTLIALIQSGKLDALRDGATPQILIEILQDIEESDGGAEEGGKEREMPSKDIKEGTDGKHETDEGMEEKSKADKKDMKYKEKNMNKKKPIKGLGRKPRVQKKTFKELRMEEEKILEAFDKIMELAGVEGEVDESNIIDSVLKAMRFIINADESTLAQMIEAIGDINIDILDKLTEQLEETDGKHEKYGHDMDDKEGIEMICYPMSMDDMKKYAMKMGDNYEMEMEGEYEDGRWGEKMKMMEMGDGKRREMMSMMGGKSEMGEKKMEHKGDKKTMIKKKEMGGKQMMEDKEKICSMCSGSMEMMKETMQTMIQVELGKTMSNLVTAMDSMSAVDPSIKAMLERIAMVKGVKEPEEKSMKIDNDEDKFENWKEWSVCDLPCGGGISIRTRVCKEEYMTGDASDCEETETKPCNAQPCFKVDEGDRKMPIPTPEKSAEDVMKPDQSPVPEMTTAKTVIVEKWGKYSNWDPCTKSCGGGVSVRSRMCTMEYMNMYSNDDCEESESKTCNEQPCPPVERLWGEWTVWTSCTVQCNGGTSYRARTCLDEQEDCTEVQSEMCNIQPCVITTSEPEREEWYEWEEWSACSKTCGAGTISRTRECVKKSASSSCQQVQTRACFEGVCPVPTSVLPFYQEWTEWTPCSVTCGSGISLRRRLCNDPTKPNCDDVASQPCQMRPCATPGHWGRWSEWSRCSQTCGFGSRTKRRSCLSVGCDGEDEMTEPCTIRATCPSTPSVVTQTGRCPPSPYRQLRIDGSCIVFHGRDSGKKSFEEYRSFCMARGGDVVRMTGLEKWIQVTYWLRTVMRNGFNAQSSMPWIGSNYDGGKWSHPGHSSKKSFVIWGQNQTKASSSDRCATLNGDNGHGFKMLCSSAHYAVCEY